MERLCERVRLLHGVLRVQAPEARESKVQPQKLQRCEIGSVCKFPEALQDRDRWHYFCTLLKPSAGRHCSGVCHRQGAHFAVTGVGLSGFLNLLLSSLCPDEPSEFADAGKLSSHELQ